MHHGLLYYARLEDLKILYFRKRYDPTINLMHDHLSIMFPVPDKISETQITNHATVQTSH
jgi:hypothetical protein